MKEEWNYKILNEMGTISRGKSKHRPRNDPALFNGKYPFIQTADVKNANLYITEYSQTYNDKGLAQSKLWQPGTLCITIAANIADTGILGIPACFPDSVMGFIPDEKISDVKFVKYCFDILQKECQSIAEGTAQDNLSWEKLSRIKFPCPPLPTQQKIASILSAYDDLIENNRKQIKLLEEAAQKLYKEWFVKLNFPGHENTKIVDGIPEGWKKVTVEQLLSEHFNGGWGKDNLTGNCKNIGKVIRGTDINDIEQGNFSGLPCRYHSDKDISNKILKPGDIVFELSNGNINNIGRNLLISQELLNACGTPVICASFCKLFRPLNFNYSILLKREMEDMQVSKRMLPYKKNGANGINNFDFDGFLKHEMLIPAERSKFYEVFNKYEKQKVNLQQKLRLLQSARDKLLPKLMNGEMEI